ncbi:Stk1 family PASTA domain-containing Ser/Thr kinase [Evansella halocellulosilytica]|uniref:Stk1 family PASTA domain-containing Ser/Thr kinase n=1 Tax=Evansella halocellulosilytica TaxID=2011013 RepID=UPI000BB96423|nr:Stk1 family PASTA domain-containing Ser/Thr kinase [Evansella halocellulosilytica]
MRDERINERYEIIKPIGGGGMADVYLAHDIILDRKVAVKVLKSQFSRDDEFIRRFRREAQAATSLSHPNVVNIYDVGEEKDLYYIVMEYVEGLTLKDYINQRGKINVHEAVAFMEQIASAVSHAHENHIIHRDLKPHNILISQDGQAKVTDFGIARAISEATITHTNSVLGSVHYLSPEQARGGNVTYQSDIYSLGIVMYEMLMGEVPFQGDTAVSVAIKHLQTPLPLLKERDPSLLQSVENVVLKATAKDPSVRFLSADELLEDLHTVFSSYRASEKRFELPQPSEDATKAMPVIKDEQVDDENKTFIHDQKTKVSNEPKNDPPKKKKKGVKYWLIAIILSILFLFGALYVAFALIPSWLHVDDVTIPDDLVGIEAEEAAEQLRELNLEVEEEWRYDDEIEEGLVLSHNPRAGATVKEGTRITLYVSEGVEPKEMTDVVGHSLERAERELEEFEDIEIEFRETSDYDDDTVLSQSPDAGDLIIPHETVVTLVVSERPTYIMDNLSGMTRDEVANTIGSNALLDLNFEDEHHPTIEEGKVISQDPQRGTEIRERTDVTVVFSLGPEPEEEPEEEPISVNVPFRVELDGNDNGDETFRVQISVMDMMNSEPRMIIDRDIRETERFELPMTVAPGESGYLLLYINEEQYEASPYEYTYEELKQYQ